MCAFDEIISTCFEMMAVYCRSKLAFYIYSRVIFVLSSFSQLNVIDNHQYNCHTLLTFGIEAIVCFVMNL